MSNTLGTTAATALIIQRALSLAVTKRPQLRAISTDFTDDNGVAGRVKLNQQIIAKLRTVPSVGTFGDAATDLAFTDVPVTLDAFKQIRHKLTAAELQATEINLIDLAAEPIAIAFANHVIDSIAALWVVGSYSDTPVTEALADFDYETLTALREALIGQGVQGPLSAIVRGTAYTKLLNDDRILRSSNPMVDITGTGSIGAVAGFANVFEYPALPTTGNMVAFGCTPEAAVIAIRPPQDPRELMPNAPAVYNLDYVTEPVTGLTVAVQEWIETDLSVNFRMIWLQGFDEGNIHAGRIVKTS